MQSTPLNAPTGFVRYTSIQEVLADTRLFAYHHLISVAWSELELDSILCINNLPTVYIHRSRTPIEPSRAAALHQLFWNQGIATLLVLIDPNSFHVYSGQKFPANPNKAVAINEQAACIESHLNLAGLAAWQDRLEVQLETGAYYQTHPEKFNREQTVDQYLLRNLSDTRNALTEGKNALKIAESHEFLGRILFTCYLIDRGIIDLRDYFDVSGKRLLDWMQDRAPGEVIDSLYRKLFPDLKKRLNGSMFDGELNTERKRIKPKHIELLKHFLSGDSVVEKQQTLGFWAYDFQMIPVETISGIYEDFLKAQDADGKHEAGAFYTPRLLAEMTLDVLLENEHGNLLEKRFLDPSCGSGIFLVLLFNRLAAEWVNRNPKVATNVTGKADALRSIFRNNLRGIDLNPTACHIACFSLYLAYLDQFDPRAIRKHCETVGKFLPNLIVSSQSTQPKSRRENIPVITETDFLKHETSKYDAYDYLIGNPPWAKIGSKSLEQKFMLAAPTHLKKSAHGGFLLPTKMLLNKTNSFQASWLKQVSIEKVVFLADYRKILFAEARCPCLIARFRNEPLNATLRRDTWIEYITPKVYGIESRNGSIPVSPEDHKWIPVERLLNAIAQGNAPNFWKSHFWGTARDQKLLSAYAEFPKIEDYAETPRKGKKRNKRWFKGRGFGALKLGKESEKIRPLNWALKERFIPTRTVSSIPFIPQTRTTTLEAHLNLKGYRTDQLDRVRDERLYIPPLVLFNNGYSNFAYIDYPVRFQHALHVISGDASDEDALLFLTAYLKSKLAYYFIFHTGANIGTERTKAQLGEALNLPFFLPDFEFAPDGSEKLLKRGAGAMRRLKDKIEKKWNTLDPEEIPEFALESDTQKERVKEWETFSEKETERVMQQTINPIIYKYFGLIDQEITLVEDTYDIIRKCITPSILDDGDGIRNAINEDDLLAYADQLIQTLSSWMLPGISTRINAVCRINHQLGLACVELIQSEVSKPIQIDALTDQEALAYLRLEDRSTEDYGSLRYLRSIRHIDKSHIRIYKAARLGFWMRSAAVNDAGALHAEITNPEVST